MRYLLYTLFGAALCFGVACDDSNGEEGGVGDPCDSNDDCRGNLICGDDDRCAEPEADGDADSDIDGDADGDGDGDVDTDADADGDEETDADEEVDAEEALPPDRDGDGLSDECEESWEGLDHRDFDSDDDGLPDGVEDANRNCEVDPGETDPTNPDSDEDGIGDGVEVMALGLCVHSVESEQRRDPLPNCEGDDDCEEDETCVFLDPLNPDMDDDSLLDGEEDIDRDGVIEVEQGETEPRLRDTDGDGTRDDGESSPVVCNIDELVVPIEHDSEQGDYTVAIDPRFTDDRDLIITDLAPEDVHAGAVADSYTDGVAVFVLSKPPTAGVTDAFAQDITDELFIEELGTTEGFTVTPLLNRQPFSTHDGYHAVTSLRIIETDEVSNPGSIRDVLVDQLSGRPDQTIIPPAEEGPYHDDADERFILRITTVWRDDDRVVLLASIAFVEAHDTLTRPTGIQARDFTNTTGLARFGFTFGAECDMFTVERLPKADFIWVVDTSGSTTDDVDRIGEVADQFFATLGRSGVDYRVGVRNACYPDEDPPMTVVVPDGYPADRDPFTRDPVKFAYRIRNSGGTAVDSCENPLHAAREAYQWLASNPPVTARPPSNLGPGLRPGALTIVVVVTDEEEQLVEEDADGGRNCHYDHISHTIRVTELIEWYNNPDADPATDDGILVFGIISPPYTDVDGDPETCDGMPDPTCGEEGDDSVAARVLIRNTGGSETPICSSAPTEEITEATINAMMEVAQGVASTYHLERIPVSSTLRLALRGRVAPRSRQNGFDYDVVSNAVIFHNSTPVSPWRPDEGDEFAVSYRFWQERLPDLPDLVAFELSPDMTDCSGGVVHLNARFGNMGTADVEAGVRVSFYQGSPEGTHSLLGTVPTEEPIPVGLDDVWVGFDYHLPEWDESYNLYVTIDDDGTGSGLIAEIDEENNTAFLLDVGCSGIF